MRIHLLSTGGAVMHNLAIALHKMGHKVTGSDDEIYDPARSRLKKYGLLPAKEGWNEANITEDIDVVILGMHARAGNPELEKAQELKLKIMSFPEFIYESSKEKKRIAVCGSHGKTSTTAIIMHVLKGVERKFDWLVGAQMEGYDLMVSLTDADTIVIEGDEYLSSAIDRRPKFMHYHPQICIITGIDWDHMNVFPTEDLYISQFEQLINSLQPGADLIFHAGDPTLSNLVRKSARKDINLHPYYGFDSLVVHDTTMVFDGQGKQYPIRVFGKHNMQNMQAAYIACSILGVNHEDIFQRFSDFSGAQKRLQLVKAEGGNAVYTDFAHAPSKVKATAEAVRLRYIDHHITAVYELHTYSSLNIEFIKQYKGALNSADKAYVFYNAHTLEMKKMPPLDPREVAACFNHSNLEVITDKDVLEKAILENTNHKKRTLLLMSSGTLGKLDIVETAEQFLSA
jgi:UDP-N-acetylmuramate: L-alanyl-gamma-D-glutamyl-meso-diaminopimelate ligase